MFEILRAWFPLALSWFFMALELPFTTAFISRLPNPQENLASFGGIAFPLAILIEAPILMLLSASTALCRDYEAYTTIRRAMMKMGAALTLVHILIVLPPFFDIIVVRMIGTPPGIQELVRLSLLSFLLWSWSVGHRRFHQGILIRFHKSRMIGVGTAVRVTTLFAVLWFGSSVQVIPGAMLGGLAVCAGALSEAVIIRIFVHPYLKILYTMRGPGISNGAFTKFYIPLALTSIIGFLNQPFASAAITRMPLAFESLAVLPVISGCIFMFRSWGMAMQEVVIARFEKEGEPRRLFQFSLLLAAVVTVPYIFLSLHPVHISLFHDVSGLSLDLASFGGRALIWGIFLPFVSSLTSYYQGLLVHQHKTKSVTTSIVVNVTGCCATLLSGVLFQPIPAIDFVLIAFSVGFGLQLFSLWVATRSTRL